MKTFSKAGALLISFLSLMLLASFAITSSDTLKDIVTKITNHHDQRPQEKLYIQLDKPYYAAGEDIWFKAYLVDAKHHIPDSAISKVLYVELLNSNKGLISRRMIYTPWGTSVGDFKLDESLPEGKYLIRAYTNYMKNMDSDFFFYKEFHVFSAFGSDPQAQYSDSIDLQFFPEGGNLLAGVENRIAFKAIGEFGKGIALEGDIVDEENRTVTSFKTEHNGMGSFKMLPISKKKYMVNLKNVVNNMFPIPFPKVLDSGYLLQISDAGDNLKVYIYSNINNSLGPIPFSLIGQTRGEVYYAAHGEIKNISLTTFISKKKFPTGITQLTLFDRSGRPQCERLIFINHHDSLKFSALPDKQSYGKREKVTLDLTVQDTAGKPVVGNLSISVYDPAIQDEAEQYRLNIENYLLLTSDLKGRIEEPGYYFKNNSLETLRNLDLLMLTHGWRRFIWKTILKNPLTPVDYFAERGIAISGSVLKALSNKPVKKSKLKIFTEQGDLLIIETDSVGQFYSDDLFFFDETKIAIQVDNAKGKQAPLQVKLDPFIVPIVDYTFEELQELDAGNFLSVHRQQSKVLAIGSATLLKETEVRSTKLERPARAKVYGTASATIKMADIPNSNAYISVLQAIQSRVPGVRVVGNPPNMSVQLYRGWGNPLFLINGTPVDLDAVMSLQPLDVESIDFLKGTSAAAFGNRAQGGVIAIYTKPGSSVLRPSVGIQHISYPGFYSARAFYTPKYDAPIDNAALLPDLRSTQYWNPIVETDEQGKAQVTFYTSDVVATYRIVVEGISNRGRPIYHSSWLEVK